MESIYFPSSNGYGEYVNGEFVTHGEPNAFYWTGTIPSGFPNEAWYLELKESPSSVGNIPTFMSGMDRSYNMFVRAILDE